LTFIDSLIVDFDSISAKKHTKASKKVVFRHIFGIKTALFSAFLSGNDFRSLQNTSFPTHTPKPKYDNVSLFALSPFLADAPISRTHLRIFQKITSSDRRDNVYIMKRDYAREQNLPQSEIEILRDVKKSKYRRNWRAKQLYDLGWTLQAIGDAFEPPIKRSTVQYWVQNAHKPANAITSPFPTPWEETDGRPVKGYQRKTAVSPGISPEDQERLAYLAPLARLFRSGMASTSLSGQANDEFNELIRSLYEKDVKIAEIAQSANVTNRAIARRLGK
jgi:hypothetical protein